MKYEGQGTDDHRLPSGEWFNQVIHVQDTVLHITHPYLPTESVGNLESEVRNLEAERAKNLEIMAEKDGMLSGDFFCWLHVWLSWYV